MKIKAKTKIEGLVQEGGFTERLYRGSNRQEKSAGKQIVGAA